MDILKFLTRTNRSQSDLARELGIDASAVNAWTRGKSAPKYELCLRLLEMGIGVDELFTPDAWEKIKADHAAEFKAEVRLTPEECADIVRSGLDALRAARKGQGRP